VLFPGKAVKPAATVLSAAILAVAALSACGGHSAKASQSSTGPAAPASAAAASSSTPPATPSRSASSQLSTSAHASATPTSKPTSGHATSSHPGTGSVLSTVATQPATTLPATPIKATADFGSGVSAHVTKIADEKVTDTGPGIISGVPAAAFTIQLVNDSKATVSLSNVQVTASYGSDETPASEANLSKARGFKGSMAPGATATGTYSFAIPTTDRSNVQVSIWYAPGQPTVLFTGAAS
jgi:hypothetical protein